MFEGIIALFPGVRMNILGNVMLGELCERVDDIGTGTRLVFLNLEKKSGRRRKRFKPCGIMSKRPRLMLIPTRASTFDKDDKIWELEWKMAADRTGEANQDH